MDTYMLDLGWNKFRSPSVLGYGGTLQSVYINEEIKYQIHLFSFIHHLGFIE